MFFVWESYDFFVDLKRPFSFYTVYQGWIFDLSTRPSAGSIKPKYFHPSCHNAFLSHIPEPNWAGTGQRRIWRTWVIECLDNIWDQLLKSMHSKRHSKTTFLTQHKTNFREQPTGMMVPTIWLWRKWVTLQRSLGQCSKKKLKIGIMNVQNLSYNWLFRHGLSLKKSIFCTPAFAGQMSNTEISLFGMVMEQRCWSVQLSPKGQMWWENSQTKHTGIFLLISQKWWWYFFRNLRIWFDSVLVFGTDLYPSPILPRCAARNECAAAGPPTCPGQLESVRLGPSSTSNEEVPAPNNIGHVWCIFICYIL